jgi:hypothetical protein
MTILKPIADQVAQGRFGALVQLIEQVGQIVSLAASLAAPLHLASGALLGQRRPAAGALECGGLETHRSPLLFNGHYLLKIPPVDNQKGKLTFRPICIMKAFFAHAILKLEWRPL